MEENVFTEIEMALKQGLEDPANVSLGDQPVPVRIVTPDPDFVELTLPVTTLQLIDVRRAPKRAFKEFDVETDMENRTARVAWPEEPYDMHYTVRGHTESARQDRLLLGQYIRFVDAHPVLAGASGRKFYLARTLSFRDRSDGRSFQKALTFVVKARLPVGIEKTVPIATERKMNIVEHCQRG